MLNKLIKSQFLPEVQPGRVLLHFVIALTFFLSSCYSFTGASISPEVETFTVNSFPNQAGMVVPNLSQDFTEALKDKFISQTNLDLLNSGGDLEFSGAITRYNISQLAASANETAAMNRLTITVNVDFQNKTEPEKNWNKSFSKYADFESSQNLSSIEDELIKEIVEQLVEDIFNNAVVDW